MLIIFIFCLTAFHKLSLLYFPLLHFPPLLSTPAFSIPAFSTSAVYSCIFHSCIFHPCCLLLNFPLLHFPLPHFQRPPLQHVAMTIVAMVDMPILFYCILCLFCLGLVNKDFHLSCGSKQSSGCCSCCRSSLFPAGWRLAVVVPHRFHRSSAAVDERRPTGTTRRPTPTPAGGRRLLPRRVRALARVLRVRRPVSGRPGRLPAMSVRPVPSSAARRVRTAHS